MPKKMKVLCCRGFVGVLQGVYRKSTSLKLCREEIFSRALPKSCISAHCEFQSQATQHLTLRSWFQKQNKLNPQHGAHHE